MKKFLLFISILLIITTNCFAALSYTFTTTIVDLACASTANIIADDYVVGGTSGATGLVLSVVDNTKYVVAELTGTPFQAETITAADSGGTASISSRTSPSSATNYPPNVILVQGSDATKTQGFRDIADNMAAGVTDPSSSSQWIDIEGVIYIGRRGQAAATTVLSQDEMLDMETSGTKNSIRVIGGADYDSTLRIGIPKYLDNDYANFPPLYVEHGSKLKLDGSGYQETMSIEVDANGIFELYDSTITTDSGYATMNMSGTMYLDNVLIDNQGNYGWISGTWYAHNLFVQNCSSYWNIVTASPSYASGLYFQNNANFIYAWLTNYEVTIPKFINYDNNGVANVETFANGGFGGGNILHFVDSETDEDYISTTFINDIECIYENSFKLKVIDGQGNPIQGATIQLKNAYGDALWTKLSATLNGAINATSDPVTATFTSTAEMTAGDKIRIGCEIFNVASVLTGTTASLNRAKYGTTKHRHNFSTANVYLAGKATTDSNGEINYDSTGNYYAVPHNMAYKIFGAGVVQLPTTAHNLIISKAGYETRNLPITISGKEGIDWVREIYHSPSAGRGAMGEAFR